MSDRKKEDAAEVDDADNVAVRAFDRALESVSACFSDGPVSGVLITYDATTHGVQLQCLNHDFQQVFSLLLRAMHTVHERLLAEKISHSFNLH